MNFPIKVVFLDSFYSLVFQNNIKTLNYYSKGHILPKPDEYFYKEKNLVINDARLVFPLMLSCYKGDPKDPDTDTFIQNMAVINGKAACNIAIAQNAPWNAFETVNTVVNTKVYTEKPRAYGKMLSKCYQSVSELQFQNNHIGPW